MDEGFFGGFSSNYRRLLITILYLRWIIISFCYWNNLPELKLMQDNPIRIGDYERPTWISKSVQNQTEHNPRPQKQRKMSSLGLKIEPHSKSQFLNFETFVGLFDERRKVYNSVIETRG